MLVEFRPSDTCELGAEGLVASGGVLTSKLTNMLSGNPEVTAHALALYDQELVEPLIAALAKYRQAVYDE